MSKTMKHPPRRVATPTASDKRKEREAFYAPEIPKIPKLAAPRAGSSKPYEPAYRNQLLAGYLAHEFLTKGTLLGEKWDPDRADAAPVPVEFKRKEKGKGKGRAEPSAEAYNRYVEVADLLKRDGAHLPGIVNPTQLGRFLHM
ncbi:uncharacterized protein LOC100242917 [Vitis vinifera]|uniref:Embryo sac development arrest 6 n=1 Tax=Vitis vinifera TaxID=29760 RepID=A0A438F1D8_VITVI|nr:uncharacterized protein LOC100242917 [Vitis vinifera]RVW53797.1 hypothetical protein CK203_101385 [Vitis vinifera]RVX19168.1 hypothetical protein CK203_008749 [Vitis vinifera]|eukprot:XP_010652391.1 PREDICTED: uncharacterized protein LOC100242917 [Vitis vinifera]